LSQVYGFVKQSGGHVKIYSESGQGTTVKIYLPRLERSDEESDAQASIRVPEGNAGETILVVEDDASVRIYSADALRDLGYRVIEAADGPSAVHILETKTPVDLLFTDVVLPGGMTGAQVAARARELRPGLKVLFTTGYVSRISRRRCVMCWMDYREQMRKGNVQACTQDQTADRPKHLGPRGAEA
jgi:CheY-like chemotaxis protein